MTPLFSCIRLDVVSAELLKEFAELKHPPHERILGYHITLEFKEGLDLGGLPLGGKVGFKIVGYDRNEFVQCVKVKILDKKLRCANKHPHVTMSVSKKGMPIQSNDLLEEESYVPAKGMEGDLTFYGRIGFVTTEGEFRTHE
jgi:hypothetical protein